MASNAKSDASKAFGWTEIDTAALTGKAKQQWDAVREAQTVLSDARKTLQETIGGDAAIQAFRRRLIVTDPGDSELKRGDVPTVDEVNAWNEAHPDDGQIMGDRVTCDVVFTYRFGKLSVGVALPNAEAKAGKGALKLGGKAA